MVGFAAADLRGRWPVAFFIGMAMAVGCASNTPPESLDDGVTAYREGRNSDAELIWLDTLAEAEAVGPEDPRLAQSLFVLGNLAIHEERYEDAKALMERWLDIQEQRHEIGDATFADGVELI